MGRRAALAIAAALIVCPIVVLVTYKHWLETRTFNPLDIPGSLSPGHITTPEFYINLTGEYRARVDVDYAAYYTPGSQEQAWRDLQVHATAYEDGVKIGDADGRSYGMIGVLTADKSGRYSLDLEIRSDGSCLNSYHPRLIISNASDFPYDYIYEVGIWTLLLTTVAGLGLIVYAVAVARRILPAKTLPIPEADTLVTTGLPRRKLEAAKLISGFPHFPLICATMLAVLVMIEMVLTAPYPSRGLSVSLNVRPADIIIPKSSTQPVVVAINAGKPGTAPKLCVNSKPVGWDGLKAELQQQLKIRPEWVVYVDGDSNVPFGDAAAVVSTAKELHAKAVLLTPETRRLVEPEFAPKDQRRR